MTTSTPNVPQPAGAGDPDPDSATQDPLMSDALEGAVPDKTDPDNDPDADAQTDSVEDDKDASAAS